MSSSISRRSLLKFAGAAAGAAVGTRLAGRGWMQDAEAANEKSALLLVFCPGGYNQMFTSTDCCLGRFGVTEAEVETIGNGLAIHRPTFGTLSNFTKRHMAAIGADVPAGQDHGRAGRMMNFDANGVPWTLRLAAAMGGDAAIKAAHLNVDGNGYGMGSASPVGGVSLQAISNLDAVLARFPQLGSAPPPDPTKPDRAIQAAVNARVVEMSTPHLDENPRSLVTLREGYNTAQNLLSRPPKPVDFAAIEAAYQLTANRSFDYETSKTQGFLTQFAAAEILIRSGTNVVFMEDGGEYIHETQFLYTWDAHAPGGTKGIHERRLMGNMLPGLRAFTSRMLEDPDYNVVVAFIGDFARSNGATNSGDETENGHSDVLSASVMGKYVKTGTTGRTYDAGYSDERFIGGKTPGGIRELWAYLADVLKVPSNPFGSNPHRLVL
jgi:hypothetical protein